MVHMHILREKKTDLMHRVNMSCRKRLLFNRHFNELQQKNTIVVDPLSLICNENRIQLFTYASYASCDVTLIARRNMQTWKCKSFELPHNNLLRMLNNYQLKNLLRVIHNFDRKFPSRYEQSVMTWRCTMYTVQLVQLVHTTTAHKNDNVISRKQWIIYAEYNSVTQTAQWALN